MNKMLAVAAVKLDDQGLVTRVIWGCADLLSDRWITGPREADVSEVVARLKLGRLVRCLQPKPGGPARTQGPALRLVTGRDGRTSIETQPGSSEEPHSIREIRVF